MKRTILILALAAIASAVLGLAVPLVRAADEKTGAPTEAVWRLHPLHYLDPREAGFVVEERIPEMLTAEDYEMRHEVLGPAPPGDARPRGYLRVHTDPASHEKIAAVLAEADRPPETHVFQFVVLGAVEEALPPPELPKGAAAALADVRSLLPFKGYRLIDSALVRSGGRSDVSLSSNYALEFAFRVGPSKDRPLQIDQFALYSRGPEGSAAKHMETSFSSRIGETVVVGTSTPRDSRQALVVLMTALE